MKKGIIISTVLLVLSLGISIPLIGNANQVKNKNQKWGESLKKTYEEKKSEDGKGKYRVSLVGKCMEQKADVDEISEAGKDILITDTELKQMSDFYVLAGKSRQEAEKLAKEYAEEYNALYVEAVKNGFDATTEEVKTYVENLKIQLKNSENQDQLKEMMKGFNSEEEYWDYECMVYQKQLPIQKYVKSLEKEYMNSQKNKIEEEEVESKWQNKLESIKKELVKKQQFKQVDEPSDIRTDFKK